MKYALIYILAFVGAFILTWAFGAYVSQTMNPLDWHDAGRFTQAFVSLAGATLATITYADLVDDAFAKTP